MVVDTLPENVKQCCSKCGEMKDPDRIVRNRKVCKDCCNKKKKENYINKVIDDTAQKTCSVCTISKFSRQFINKESKICMDCNNQRRRKQYQECVEVRKKKREDGIKYKKKKKSIRDESKLVEITKLEEEIGQDNTICKYCKTVRAKTRFRHNRLKCKDCERDEPFEKFKRYVRTRIYNCLKGHKTKHAHEYLGCTPDEYLKWILFNKNNFTLENYGSVWHIDHIIPLSKFNLENEQDILVAFNWRNTMPLLAKENLSKNNKILTPQIEEHLKKLITYHIENSIELPDIYINLFAKYLAAGIPLEP
jgi:hypothetical protein